MKILLSFILFFVCFDFAGCSNQSQKPKQESQPHEQTNQVQAESRSAPSDPNPFSLDKSTKKAGPTATVPSVEKDKIILDVPIIKQNPELKYGCEVTSLAMVLNYAGIKTDKMRVADELPKDNDPVQKAESGDIIRWGNPDHGFVGDITGKNAGFAVYAGPLEKVMKRYLPDRTVNLTKKSFDEVLEQIKNGKPVILWTTGDYKIPDRWESWKHENETINTPLDLHAVVLVGFDKENLFLNDPLSGKKAQKTNKDTFLESWKELGQQALSYQ